MNKIISKLSYALLPLSLFSFSLFSLANGVLANEVAQVNASKISLDSRDNFNSRSIYTELGDNEVVFFEKVDGFRFHGMELNISKLPNKQRPAPEISPWPNFDKKSKYTSLSGLTEVNGEKWLYVTIGEKLKRSPATVMRGKLNATGKLTNITPVKLNDRLRPLSWPFVHYNKGMFYLVYRKAKCCDLGFATSVDGINFTALNSIDKPGFMPMITSFADNSLIYTYQRFHPTGQRKSNGKPEKKLRSSYRISKDQGKTWSAEQIMTDSFFEVHDAFPFLRKDGNIDLYYSHGLNRKIGHMSLWRRCVNSEGKLGKEQLLADERVGHIAKPNVYRRADGSIALLFIEQGENIMNGAIQYFSVLPQDALCEL